MTVTEGNRETQDLSSETRQNEKVETKEVISAELHIKSANAMSISEADIRAELEWVNQELDRYVNHADREEYAIAVGVGIVAGMIDSLCVHKKKTTENDPADLAQHPTARGILSAILVQILRVGINEDGNDMCQFQLLETDEEASLRVVMPAMLTGILNWLVNVDETEAKEEVDKEVPAALLNIAKFAAATPVMTEIARCADNWLDHLVSGIVASNNISYTELEIREDIVSLFREIDLLPILNSTGLLDIVNDLYEHIKIELQQIAAVLHLEKKQLIPVLFMELCTRVLYFAAELEKELGRVEAAGGNLEDVNWRRVLPFDNRSVNRMLSIASMTFSVADTADAAVHAAIEAQGNWILFSGRFVARYNYAGAGRAACAIVKEIYSEKKEEELIHQKRILMENLTGAMIEKLEKYKAWLEESVMNFLAEDITEFMNGFDDIQKGMETKNSDLVIQGNLTIQTVLGRKPQFMNQQEFDDLMDSDEAFVL